MKDLRSFYGISLLELMLVKYIILILPILLLVAFFTLLERKILRLVGIRLGPNKVSLYGVFQPFADALKLINKQTNKLSNFNINFYYFRTIIIIIRIIVIWICLATNPEVFYIKFTFIFLIVILSFNSLNVIISGWRTFRKYSLIGSMRRVAQLISYESVLYICVFFLFWSYSRFNSKEIFSSFSRFENVFLLPTVFLIWLISILAELNRTPYDFSEGERELVRGFNTEFGSQSFTFIFLAEYGNIAFFRLITSLIFFSKIIIPFFIFINIFIIWIRSVLPRFRFDKLIELAWKVLIPILTILFISYVLFSRF